MLGISLSLALQDIMNAGDKGVCACDTMLNTGNNSVCVYNIMAKSRDVCICVDSDFGLEVNSQR